MKKLLFPFSLVIILSFILSACNSLDSDSPTNSENTSDLNIKKSAWDYVQEKGWDETVSGSWEKAEIAEVVVNDDYTLEDDTFLDKKVKSVNFQDKENVGAGTPIILVDPETTQVVGYLSTE